MGEVALEAVVTDSTDALFEGIAMSMQTEMEIAISKPARCLALVQKPRWRWKPHISIHAPNYLYGISVCRRRSFNIKPTLVLK